MADPTAPHIPRLLADTSREPVSPGSVLLRLETTSSREGLFDGAWWPRSRDLGSELPGLVTALTARLGTITRVGVDANAWDEIPGHLVIDDRAVRIDCAQVGDHTMIVTRGDRDHFLLLMIPPQATAAAARAAMARAVEPDNSSPADQILAAAGIIAAPSQALEDEGPTDPERGGAPTEPAAGLAEVRITAATPDAARAVAELLRHAFAGCEQRSYPVGRNGSGTRLYLTVDTAHAPEPAESFQHEVLDGHSPDADRQHADDR